MRARRTTRQANAWDGVGAVVIGGDYQGLGIVRSLGRRGIPSCVLDDELSISGVSRYTRHAARVAHLRSDEQLLDGLRAIRERYGLAGWVVYPTRDENVAALARNRELLEPHFRLATGSWESVRYAWDKRNTYSLARQLEIPIPQTAWPQDADELEQFAPHLPLALKPAIKEHFFYTAKVKAWRADTLEQLRELFARAATFVPAGELMLQEMIPGDGQRQFSYCALYENGQPRASMVVRRGRQHPPEFGRASTYVTTVDEVPEIETWSQRFLSEIAYDGLVEMEFKQDPRDDVCKLLDFNARTWGYHSLGAKAGVDFPYLQFLAKTGGQFDDVRTRTGVSWVRLMTDMPTAVLELLGGRLDLGPYVRTLRKARVEAVFTTDDPAPGLLELALMPYVAVKRGL